MPAHGAHNQDTGRLLMTHAEAPDVDCFLCTFGMMLWGVLLHDLHVSVQIKPLKGLEP